MEKKKSAVIIGDRLRKIRDIRPRTGVAKAVNVSYSALCNYENGLRIPPDDVKIRLADYYGVSVQELFYNL